jgi:hypothetical protein
VTGASGSWFASDAVHSARPIDLLTAAAVAYLALPVLVFCAGWLRLPYGVIACLLLLGALGVAARPRSPARLPYSVTTLLLAVATAFAWAAFGGAGHLFYANSDWVVRDAVLLDLVNTPWPPSYGEYGGDPMILRTTIAYFLPAAALGSVLGAGYADGFLYVWTALGAALFLLLLPLPQRPGARLALAIGVIVMFSGMDIVGVALIAGYLPAPPMHLEWWAHPLQYSSHTTQLFWVPNHALPAWIATALFYRHWREPAFWPLAVLIGALLPLWSPFAALGMAPFFAYLAVDRLRRGAGLWLPPAVLIPALLLLALEIRYLGLGFATLDANTPAEAVFDAGKYVFKYARFALLEFALLSVALFAVLRDSRGLCAVSFGVLALLPLVSFGPSNDIVMRTSIPSLAMLAILCLRILAADDTRPAAAARLPRLLVIVALCLGAVTPLYEFWRAVARPSWRPSLERTLLEVANGQFAPNYFGRLDRADLKAILRPPTLVAPRRSP